MGIKTFFFAILAIIVSLVFAFIVVFSIRVNPVDAANFNRHNGYALGTSSAIHGNWYGHDAYHGEISKNRIHPDNSNTKNCDYDIIIYGGEAILLQGGGFSVPYASITWTETEDGSTIINDAKAYVILCKENNTLKWKRN